MIDILEKSGIGLALKALVGVLGIPGVIDASLLTLDRLNSLNLVDWGFIESLMGSKNLYVGIYFALKVFWSLSKVFLIEERPTLSVVAKLNGELSIFLYEFPRFGLKGSSTIFLSNGLALKAYSSLDGAFSFSSLFGLIYDKLNSLKVVFSLFITTGKGSTLVNIFLFKDLALKREEFFWASDSCSWIELNWSLNYLLSLVWNFGEKH